MMKHRIRVMSFTLLVCACLIPVSVPAQEKKPATSKKQKNSNSNSNATSANKEKDSNTIYLIGKNSLATWREPLGDWQVAGGAALDPQDNKKLVAQPGQGVLINGPQGKTRDLISKQEFGDVEARVEFMIASHSNSGVYFMGRYELQIFDSFGMPNNKLTFYDCGSIYERWKEEKGFEGKAPRVNASRRPGEWQTFDVVFRAPRFDKNGKKIANARFVQVRLNGAVIQMDQEVTGPTRTANSFIVGDDEKPTGPILLQGDHGPVAFRNIRIRPVKLD